MERRKVRWLWHWTEWQAGLRLLYMVLFLLGKGECGDVVDMGALQNVSQVIEDLLNGYDIRLRPQFGGRYWRNNNP